MQLTEHVAPAPKVESVRLTRGRRSYIYWHGQ